MTEVNWRLVVMYRDNRYLTRGHGQYCCREGNKIRTKKRLLDLSIRWGNVDLVEYDFTRVVGE